MLKRGSNENSFDAQQAHEVNPEQQSTLPMDVEWQIMEQQPTRQMAVEQRNRERQPTQEANLDQQTTLPLAIEWKTLDQQPTQSMALEPRDLAQLSTQSVKVAQRTSEQQRVHRQGKKQHPRSNNVLIWWVLLLIFAFLLISIVVGGSAIEGWFSQNVRHNESTTPVAQVNHLPATPTQSSTIDTTVKLFMDALMRKDWAAMWPMLSPDAQKLWRGEKDFIHFEQAKYGSLKFTSYHESSAQEQYTWRDPDTTQVYPDVVTLRVSLEATAPKGLLTAPSSLALSKGLFKNTLFTLLLDHGNFRVLVAGPADPDAPILVPATPPTTKLLVPIFMYHHVSNLPTRNLLDYGLTVTTTDFNAQLDWFHQHGYHSITETELFDALYYGKALPAHPMVLTFDDGYEDVYTDALPALLAHHYRGVFYIITGMMGGHYMTWNQMRRLAQDGMQIASHTIHHVNVGQPPAWTSTQDELLLSKKTLETQLGQPIQFFCYPTGEPFHHDPVYEQQIVLADLFTDSYVGATLDPFSFDSALQNAQIPYQQPRIRVSGGESLQLFINILNSTLNIDAYRLANGLAY